MRRKNSRAELSEAQKMDILLSFIKRGYNLRDTEDPATLSMDLGNGHTLYAGINNSWTIKFNDGLETTTHNIDSPKILYTHAKDARTLHREYNTECKRVLADMRGEEFVEDPEPETQEETPVKTLDTVIDDEVPQGNEEQPEPVDPPVEAPKEVEVSVPCYENCDRESRLLKRLDDLLKLPTKADKNISWGEGIAVI